MTRRALLGLIGLATVATASHPRREPARAMPPKVILDPILKDVRTEDRPRLMVPARMFRQIDLNGDGFPDWVADFAKSGESGFCGTGGCRLVIYASKPGGYASVFDEQVREFKLTPRGDGMRLDIDVHGSFCGTFGASECPMSFRWEQPRARFIEVANVKGGTRLQSSVLASADPAKPALVKTVEAEQAAACRQASGKLAEDGASGVTVPDLNGDGSRDWIVSAPYCPLDGDKPAAQIDTVVLLTSPTGLIRATNLAPGGYAIDIATRPAQLVQLLGSECGYNTICAERVLAWDAAAGKFATIAEHPARTLPGN